jgi:DNA invertase Pin-like site-specific DNA recombinase
VVLVWKLDSFARSALDALLWLRRLDSARVGLKILTQEIDTTTSAGRLMFTILAAVAEMGRELIRERVRAGMARARSQGRRLGRPPRAQPLSAHPMWRVVVAGLEAGHLNRAEAARELSVRRTTLGQALQAVRKGVARSRARTRSVGAADVAVHNEIVGDRVSAAAPTSTEILRAETGRARITIERVAPRGSVAQSTPLCSVVALEPLQVTDLLFRVIMYEGRKRA